MEFHPIGDMARLFQSRQQNTDLKTVATVLGQELSSGRKANLSATFSGNFAPLASIEHDLRRLDAYAIVGKELSLKTDTMQSALETVAGSASTTASSILAANGIGGGTGLEALAGNAKQAFSAVVSTLNARISDQSVFAGSAFDQPALADADTFTADMITAIGAVTNSDDLVAALDTWFADPSGFEATSYLGGSAPQTGVAIGDNKSIRITVTAADKEIRDVLTSFAIGALAANQTLGLSSADRANLLQISGERLLTTGEALTGIQAKIGTLQAFSDQTATARKTEISVLSITKTELVAADPYDTATQFEAAQLQLESFYAVTARMSRLSLANYL